MYSSLAGNKKSISINQKIGKFKESLIVGGDVKANQIMIKDKPVYIVSLNQIKGLTQPPEIYIEKIIRAQREFWADDEFENYLVVLLEKACDDRDLSASGMHFDNAIILKLTDC